MSVFPSSFPIDHVLTILSLRVYGTRSLCPCNLPSVPLCFPHRSSPSCICSMLRFPLLHLPQISPPGLWRIPQGWPDLSLQHGRFPQERATRRLRVYAHAPPNTNVQRVHPRARIHARRRLFHQALRRDHPLEAQPRPHVFVHVLFEIPHQLPLRYIGSPVAIRRCHTAFCTLPDRYGLCNRPHSCEIGPQPDERAALHSGRATTQSGEDEAKASGEHAGFELANHHYRVNAPRMRAGALALQFHYSRVTRPQHLQTLNGFKPRCQLFSIFPLQTEEELFFLFSSHWISEGVWRCSHGL